MHRRRKRRRNMSSSSNGEKVPLARGRNTSKKRKNTTEVSVAAAVAGEKTNESSKSKKIRVLKMKEGPPTASAVASSSSLIISNPMALEIAEEEGGEAVISLLPEVQAPSKRPIAVTTTSTATVMTTKTSDIRGFQSTDTVKRLRKLCRDFYREATNACLFIDQQAYADKERWSNEPPYVILCQNYVGRCVKDINDRVCMLAEKVERLETELDSLVIPVNKMVFSNPHPFDGHSQRRVVNALERWRLVQNDSFFRFHFSSKEFAHVSNDLTEKNKQLEAKLRHELKKTTCGGW